MGSLPLWKGATMRTIQIQNNQWSSRHCSVLCIIQLAAPFAHHALTISPTPTHTFLKRPFLTDFEKYTHTPPKETKFWRIGPKVHKTQEKCQNPPCWRRWALRPPRCGAVQPGLAGAAVSGASGGIGSGHSRHQTPDTTVLAHTECPSLEQLRLQTVTTFALAIVQRTVDTKPTYPPLFTRTRFPLNSLKDVRLPSSRPWCSLSCPPREQ